MLDQLIKTHGQPSNIIVVIENAGTAYKIYRGTLLPTTNTHTGTQGTQDLLNEIQTEIEEEGEEFGRGIDINISDKGCVRLLWNTATLEEKE